MKRKTFSVLSLAFNLLILSTGLIAQTSPDTKVVQIQPTIMVIPYTNQYQDLRNTLDSSLTLRVAIAKVKEAFNSRGFTTIDFVAKLKASKSDAAFMAMSAADAKTALIEGSGSDIYVSVEANEIRSSSGNKVRLILNAYDAFTGRDMGTKTSQSESIFTEQFDALVERAIYKPNGENKIFLLEDFLNDMTNKFEEIVRDGRSIKIEFSVEPTSNYNYDSEVGTSGDLLKDAIDDWMAENAYKNNYHQQGITDLKLIYDDVRIPLRDENNRNFTVSRFSRKLRNYCNTLTVDNSTQIKVTDSIKGTTIFITLK